MGSREQQFHEECSWYEWHSALVQSIPPLTQEEYATCIVRLFFEPRMDKSPGVTMKNTKYTKNRGSGIF